MTSYLCPTNLPSSVNMSLKRKFDYTSETMFKRANKLASDCGADVLVVVRYHGDFSIYRNVGVDWAQQLDINHLVSMLLAVPPEDASSDEYLYRKGNYRLIKQTSEF